MVVLVTEDDDAAGGEGSHLAVVLCGAVS